MIVPARGGGAAIAVEIPAMDFIGQIGPSARDVHARNAGAQHDRLASRFIEEQRHFQAATADLRFTRWAVVIPEESDAVGLA
jgi:hypothetical protein